MVKPVEIVIADDHSLIRKGLKQVLEYKNEYLIYEASEGAEALDLIRLHQPDVAILDIEMPKLTGFDVARSIQNEGLSVNLIFLTMYRDESVFNLAMDIGVKGYVLKENTVNEIVKCIETVLAGKHYLSPEISEFLIRRSTRVMSSASDKDGLSLLTPTERNILKLIRLMKTNKEIAYEFGVSLKTIQNHRNNICNKLGIHGRNALLKFTVEHADQL